MAEYWELRLMDLVPEGFEECLDDPPWECEGCAGSGWEVVGEGGDPLEECGACGGSGESNG